MASRKVIKTFTTSDYTKYSLLAGSTPGTPQSMCSISEDNHVVVHNQGNSNNYGYLARYSSKKAYGKSDPNNYRGNNKMEHGNGCCYIQPLRVIATKTSSGSTVQIFDAVTLKHKYSVSAAAGSGIAYDKITGQVIIRSSSYITVFPYTYFDGRTKGVGKKKINIADLGGVRQDCGAYNGVLYSINSPGKTHSYMDCYNTGTGEYLGSYSIPSLKELESVDFIGNSCYGCSASTRYFLHFKGAFNLKGSKASIAGDTTSTNAGATGYQGGSYTTDEKVARESLIKKYGNEAKTYFQLRDDGYSHNGACAIMGNIRQESNFNTTVISYDGAGSVGICQWTGSRKTNLKTWCTKNGLKWDSIEGQVKFLEHELESYKDLNSKLKSGSDGVKALTELFEKKFERAGVPRMESRIKYALEFDVRYKAFAGAKFTGMYLGDDASMSGSGFVAHVEQMISSQNYRWINDDKVDESFSELMSQVQRDIEESINKAVTRLHESTAVNISSLLSSLAGIVSTTVKRQNTKLTGRANSSKLSSSPTWVEAPWIGVNLGGVFIGDLTRGRAPNYINSIKVDKMNGRVNVYNITLIHQIAPGDDPNYIDELIGKNGYNKISIVYGDQNASSFKDEEAIITNVTQSFNFSSSQISYNITATSNSIAISSAKYTYPYKKDKPSNVIMDLLYEDSAGVLLQAFPGMIDQSKVLEYNLIPTDDLVVDLETCEDTNPLMYLNGLVSSMICETNKAVTGDVNDSIYMLTYHSKDDIFDGDYFKITKISSGKVDFRNDLYYEVDVNYDPGDSFVYDFSIENDYGWTAAYSNNAVDKSTYVYDIKSRGNLVKASGVNNVNWWTQVTNFPVTASLTVKGLLNPLMLMTYIKINHVYFGNKRLTSGMYAVIGQSDTLDGSGFKTTLKLLRVAGDNQYLTTDGRVAT